MTLQMTYKSELHETSIEEQNAWHKTCQDCYEEDEFLMTFEARTIPARWLCSSCYWKQVSHFSTNHTI